MEPTVRGLVERFIDTALEEKTLQDHINFIRSLRPAVSSVEDAVLGFILGDTFGRLNHYYKYVKKIKVINDDIINDYSNIVTRRIQEIKSKINELANL